MSGLAALCGLSIDRSSLEPMIERIAYRGDQAPTFWQDGRCAIAHTHRVTTPEAANEHHALASADGLVAAADARIDNRKELISALGVGPDATDLDLILDAYRTWGTESPAHLIGDFAFVIWDPRSSTLFGCRDHLGVRPLCYLDTGDTFMVASEPKAVAAHPDHVDRVDGGYVIDSLRRRDVPPDRTAYTDVRKLRAGHAFTLVDGRLDVWRYWDLNDAPELNLTESEAVDEFRRLFDQAVQGRLRSPGRIALHLSGGLDSSSITAVSARLLGQDRSRLTAITNSFATVPECDETSYATEVLEAVDVSGVTTAADVRGPLDTLEDVVDELNEPFVGANHHLVWFLSQAVETERAVVCLDGFDGDAVVSHGWELLEELSDAGRWTEAIAEIDAMVNTSPHWSRSAIVRNYVEPWIMDSARRLQVRRALGAARTVAGTDGGYRKRLRRQVIRAALGRVFRGHRPRHHTTGLRLSRHQHLKGLPEAGVTRTLEWLDMYAALCGAEVRHPFMDVRMVEFCVGLPADLKLRHGYGRWILRAAMEGELPSSIQWRPDKTNMNPNFAHGLLRLDDAHLRDVLEHDLPELGTNVDAHRLADAVSAMSADARESVDARSVATVWRAIVVARVLARRWPGALQSGDTGPSS